MARSITKPVAYYGGKQALVPLLLSLLPLRHECYLEPFFGGGAVLFGKQPSSVEAINDADQAVVSFFRVLRDPVRAAQLRDLLKNTPYARLEWEECRAGWRTHQTTDEVELARRWYTAIFQSYGAHLASAGWSYTKHAGNNPAPTWRHAIDALPRFAERLRDVQIDYGDFADVIARYDAPETVIYADPPYVADTRARGCSTRYSVEMSTADHRRLLRVLTRDVAGMVLLSSYDGCELYESVLPSAGWTCERRDVRVPSSTTRRRTTECVWLNPALSARLASERDQDARRQASLWETSGQETMEASA